MNETNIGAGVDLSSWEISYITSVSQAHDVTGGRRQQSPLTARISALQGVSYSGMKSYVFLHRTSHDG